MGYEIVESLYLLGWGGILGQHVERRVFLDTQAIHKLVVISVVNRSFGVGRQMNSDFSLGVRGVCVCSALVHLRAHPGNNYLSQTLHVSQVSEKDQKYGNKIEKVLQEPGNLCSKQISKAPVYHIDLNTR